MIGANKKLCQEIKARTKIDQCHVIHQSPCESQIEKSNYGRFGIFLGKVKQIVNLKGESASESFYNGWKQINKLRGMLKANKQVKGYVRSK